MHSSGSKTLNCLKLITDTYWTSPMCQAGAEDTAGNKVPALWSLLPKRETNGLSGGDKPSKKKKHRLREQKVVGSRGWGGAAKRAYCKKIPSEQRPEGVTEASHLGTWVKASLS